MRSVAEDMRRKRREKTHRHLFLAVFCTAFTPFLIRHTTTNYNHNNWTVFIFHLSLILPFPFGPMVSTVPSRPLVVHQRVLRTSCVVCLFHFFCIAAANTQSSVRLSVCPFDKQPPNVNGPQGEKHSIWNAENVSATHTLLSIREYLSSKSGNVYTKLTGNERRSTLCIESGTHTSGNKLTQLL